MIAGAWAVRGAGQEHQSERPNPRMQPTGRLAAERRSGGALRERP